MSHYEDLEEGERGEIRERDRSRSIDYRERERTEHRDRERERDRDYERPPYHDARYAEPPRRNDAYVPSRAPHPAPYARDTRDWRDRDGRDEREWTRDRGRGRYFRGGRGSWRDDRGRDRDYDRERDREMLQERDREREPRSSYDRRPERAWERDDDRGARYPGEGYYNSLHPSSRRPESDYRHQSPPPSSRARRRSPPPYLRRPISRSPSPHPPIRKRSPSRTREESRSRAYRRRSSSSSSRRSISPRRNVSRPPLTQPASVYRKRDRSNSPVGSDARTRRRVRTASRSSASERHRSRSPPPSPVNHRILTRPVTKKDTPTKPTHLERQSSAAKAPEPNNWSNVPRFPRSQAEIFTPAKKSPALDTNTPTINSPSHTPPVPPPAVTRVESEPKPIVSPVRMHGLVASPSLSAKVNSLSGPRPVAPVVVAAPAASTTPATPAAPATPTTPTTPSASMLQIPQITLPKEDEEIEAFDYKHQKWYETYLTTKVALRHAVSEAAVASFEYRSAEMRRIYTEQQMQRALES